MSVPRFWASIGGRTLRRSRTSLPFPSGRPIQSRLSPGAYVAIGGASVAGGLWWGTTREGEKAQKSESLWLYNTDKRWSPVQALDLAAANRKLRQEEYTGTFAGKSRFDFVRLSSNSPVEDDYTHGAAPGPEGRPWEFWGVFDGHAGWATSALLRKYLVPYVSDELASITQDSPSDTITSAITRAFTRLDDTIMTTASNAMKTASSSTPGSFGAALAALAPAIAGSCALLSIYDPHRSTLRVACVGDSRAVLGRFNAASSTYVAQALSADQTGFNQAEWDRVTAAHPGEDKVLDSKTGRLLGIAVTRAFGDHRWKWHDDLVREAQEKFFGSAPRPGAVTQPYMTAEPVITETQIAKGDRGDFVIMASDGLWDHISSEDAVECVARWLEAKRKGPIPTVDPNVGEFGRDEEPMFELDEGKYVEWKATPKHFVVEDENAATHLVKNAFGGSRRELFRGVVSSYPPISRNVRDDVTVQVIFFGDV